MKIYKTGGSVELLDEAIIADYVAGHIDDDKILADFEEKLASSETLQKKVDHERQFRNALVAYEDSNNTTDVINNDGLDKLFAKLDDLEEAQTTKQVTNPTTRLRFTSGNWLTFAGMAASVTFATFLFIGYQSNINTPDFALLSEKPSAKQVSFNNLVKAQRVAHIWLVSEMSPKELTKLFSENQLTAISRSGKAWVVESSQVLSAEQIRNLETIKNFKKVSLISPSSETGKANK